MTPITGKPKGYTRKLIARWLLVALSLILARLLFSGVGPIGDLPDNASAVLTIMVPSLLLGLLGFLAEQGLGDHSARKTEKDV